MIDVEIIVRIPGATDEELERGRLAAWWAFKDDPERAWGAFAARFKLEGEQEALTDADARDCALLEEAERAAASAACVGWAEPIEFADLKLSYDRDALKAAYPPQPQIIVDIEAMTGRNTRRNAEIYLCDINGKAAGLETIRGLFKPKIIERAKEQAARHGIPVERITIRDYSKPAYRAPEPGGASWGFTIIPVD